MKRRNMMALALCVLQMCIILAACSGKEPDPSVETVNNLFDQPYESEAVIDKDIDDRVSVSFETASFSTACTYMEDENGRYYPYTGGDMKMTYSVELSGSIFEYGVGIYLFLDGRAQPYKLSADGKYSYMHVLYPPSGKAFNVDFYFTPITGKKGDELQLYPLFIFYPDYVHQNDEGTVTMDDGPFSVTTPGPRMKLEADPPAFDGPEVENLLISSNIDYIDTTSVEIGGWTDEQLRTEIAYKMYLDGTDLIARDFFVPTDGKVDVRFEIWGAPSMEYGLVFMVNNRLVSVDEEDLIIFGLEAGKKAIIDVTLELPDYETLGGYSTVFALLVPRNFDYREMDPFCGFWADRANYFYLYEDRNHVKEKMEELYGDN